MNIKKTWSYSYPLLKQFDWLGTTLILSLITNGLIAIAIIAADIHRAIANLIQTGFVFWMIFGIYFLSCLIVAIAGKGYYQYHYLLTDRELIVSGGKGAVPIDHELAVDRRIGNHVDLMSVSRLKLLRSWNKIRITGKLTATAVYAPRDEIDEIWDLLKNACPNAAWQ